MALHDGTPVYGPILSSNEIRLLQLEPGHREIRCSLTVHRLDANPTYEAISYAWGDPRKARLIICNGQHLYIGKNLFQALCQLRRNGQAALLWIDALCINQASNPEKSVQVRMMRQIYERAIHVRVWLGLAEDGDEAGLALMRRIDGRCGRSRPDDLQKDFTPLELLGLPGVESPDWKALGRILYRPWFFRIWIVQEILVARRSTFLLGPYHMDGDAVLGFAGTCEKFRCIYDAVAINATVNISSEFQATVMSRSQSTAGTVGVSPSAKTLWLLRFTLREQWLSMVELLNNTRSFQATDPRDRVFAVVGLASDLDPEFVRSLVDYEKSLADIQTELAIWFLRHQNRADTLLFSYVESTGHSILLPSWVPDWIGRGHFQNSLAATYYSFEDAVAMPNPRVDRRIISGSRIKLACTILDDVAETIDDTPYIISAPLSTEPRCTSQHWRRMKAWDDSCWDLAERMYPSQQMLYPPTGENLFEAYWRTLIFDTDSEHRGCRASPELGQVYKIWVSGFTTSYEVTKSLEEQSPDGAGQLDLEALGQSFRLVAQAQASYPWETAFQDYSSGRKFCATKKGYLGWVSVAARPGDTVCYFDGNPLPFVIRRCEMQGYQLIGDCYLHGMMRGPPRGLLVKKIVLF